MESELGSHQQTQRKKKVRRQIPPPCQYCQRTFTRHEHLQRHLRTHTNEKPYQCQLCPKSFGRSDLLGRHSRLIHSSSQQVVTEDEGVNQESQAWTSDPNFGPSIEPVSAVERSIEHDAVVEQHDNLVPTQQSNEFRQWQASSQVQDVSVGETREDDFENDNILQFTLSQPLQDPMQDFNLFLESIGLDQGWEPELLSSVESPYLTTDFSTVLGSELQKSQTGACHSPRLHNDDAIYSTFGSRLPSLQPETRDLDGGIENHLNGNRTLANVSSIYHVQKQEYRAFVKKLEILKDILPCNFTIPSRWSLSRSLDGFIDGLNEHQPFIHAPTTSVESCSPAFILALAACGSQYRFEEQQGLEFFHAARAILVHDLHRQGRFTPSVAASHGILRLENNNDSIAIQQEKEELMEHIRSLLLLTIFATWGKNQAILQDILSFQGVLASMIRDHGLNEDETTSFNPLDKLDNIDWHFWVRQEQDRRTKLAAFTFFNLHSIMYNRAPLILNADLKLNLPCSSGLWKAANATDWRLAYESCLKSGLTFEMPFQTSFALLFSRPPSIPNSQSPSTPLGNHVLLHAIFQHIYFARQLCIYPSSQPSHSLRSEDLTMLEDVLRAWKLRWKQTPESSTNPRNPAGPIAFTSAALLGQAYVRLYLNLGPSRALISQDPVAIAQSLTLVPPVQRTSGLVMALLHAAHALSVPVRLGIDFVARSHSFYWSVQHSLVSLEYAFLLSQWLLAIPATGGPKSMSEREKLLFLWIKRMVDETKLTKHPIIQSNGHEHLPGSRRATLDLAADVMSMKQLGSAIVRIWVKTFRGNTCWGIVDLVGQSLEAYTLLLEES